MRNESIIILLLSVLTVHAVPVKLPNSDVKDTSVPQTNDSTVQADEDEEQSRIYRWITNLAKPVQSGNHDKPDDYGVGLFTMPSSSPHFSPEDIELMDMNSDTDTVEEESLIRGDGGPERQGNSASPKAKFKLPFNDGQFKCKFKTGERGVASRRVASEIHVMSFFVVCSPSDKYDWKPELNTGRVGKTDSVKYGPYQVTFSETSEGVFPEIDELKLAAAANFDEFRNAAWDM
jgi:hypothetical protein